MCRRGGRLRGRVSTSAGEVMLGKGKRYRLAWRSRKRHPRRSLCSVLLRLVVVVVVVMLTGRVGVVTPGSEGVLGAPGWVVWSF